MHGHTAEGGRSGVRIKTLYIFRLFISQEANDSQHWWDTGVTILGRNMNIPGFNSRRYNSLTSKYPNIKKWETILQTAVRYLFSKASFLFL